MKITFMMQKREQPIDKKKQGSNLKFVLEFFHWLLHTFTDNLEIDNYKKKRKKIMQEG